MERVLKTTCEAFINGCTRFFFKNRFFGFCSCVQREPVCVCGVLCTVHSNIKYQSRRECVLRTNHNFSFFFCLVSCPFTSFSPLSLSLSHDNTHTHARNSREPFFNTHSPHAPPLLLLPLPGYSPSNVCVQKKIISKKCWLWLYIYIRALIGDLLRFLSPVKKK